MLYLWNTAFNDTSREISLEFFDSSNGEITKFGIDDYKPYFLTVHPLSKNQEAAVVAIQGEVEVVKKRNLFTDEIVQLAKIKAWNPAFLKRLSGQFSNVWESEIEYGKSYIYDTRLIFGAPYTRQGNNFVMTNIIEQSIKQKFDKAFEQEKRADPLKYAQIEEWFNLCHQSVPDIPSGLLDVKKKQENAPENVYLAFLLARIANIPLPEAYTSRRVSNWIKSMIYTYLRKNNTLVPTPEELRRGIETHSVPGALTVEPEAGIHFNTVVCDFESLYPSCIDSYNLSYETVDCSHEECNVNKISEAGHHICTKRRGFYSLLIGALKDLRIRWFKPLSNELTAPEEERHLAKAASTLIKLVSVSSYGVTVRIHGVACSPLAESITGYGRWALQTTWRIAEDNGLHPIYGDTDSIFLDNPSPMQVQTLIDTVKNKLNLDLAIEKQYTLCVLPKAKKAYFGIEKDGTPDLKGLTAIKSNAPNFIQQVFRDCIEVLSHVRNIEEYVSAKNKMVAVVHGAIKMLHEREVKLEDLAYSVKLYYDPTERASAKKIMPQAYQCALQLMDAGQNLSRRDIVRFIKVKPFSYKGKIFTVRPVEHVKDLVEVNVEDYVRNLTTALEQVFEPMEIKLTREVKLTDWFET